MQTRVDALSGVLARAERERLMPPLVVVSSDEALLALEAQDALRQSARALGYTEREVLNVDARFDWSKLTQATLALSLFAERRIIEVRLPTGKPGVAGATALEALAESVPADTLTLIALPKLDRKTREARWASALARAGTWLDIETIERARLPQWIGERLARQRQSVPPDALEFIADRVEGNLFAAHQEIAKLALLYPAGGLSLDQVRDAVLNVARYDVSQLQAAMVGGDRKRVAKTMAGLRDEGEALPLIIWAIAEELRALIRVKALVASGRPLAAAARENRIWGPRERLFERALGRLDLDRLEHTVARIADIDRLAKGLRAPKADSDPWLELTDIALDVAT
ncbi:MAG TPA: DNA polymerase III subunit delta [Burkholderiaceae bacterium]|nr:DNA polymerase III subunit delta [Burkholderiaceae bacterium]